MSDKSTPQDKQSLSLANETNLAEAMKRGMRCLASGVIVLATRNEEGEPQGMTITAINSVSDKPPSLLVCVNRETASFRALQFSREFTVNVLNENQQAISDTFAFSAEGKGRFEYGSWQPFKTSSVLHLHNALATFYCRCDQFVEYGTHCVVIAKIIDVAVSAVETEPLIYCNGGYHRLQP